MARVIFIVAQQGFRDEELFDTQAVLEAAGHACVIASHAAGPCTGTRGGRATAELALSAVDSQQLDALVFVGGPGARTFFTNATALRLAREVHDAGQVVAAICVAPVTLVNAGLLNGKRATVFASERRALSSAGAQLEPEGVVTDGKIVTASGPEHARAFGQAIVRALSPAERKAAPRVSRHASHP